MKVQILHSIFFYVTLCTIYVIFHKSEPILFPTLNSRMSTSMFTWCHKLCYAKTCVGPTFTLSNEAWYNTNISIFFKDTYILPLVLTSIYYHSNVAVLGFFMVDSEMNKLFLLDHFLLLKYVILKLSSSVLLNRLGNIFPYCPVDRAIRRINYSNIDLQERLRLGL